MIKKITRAVRSVGRAIRGIFRKRHTTKIDSGLKPHIDYAGHAIAKFGLRPNPKGRGCKWTRKTGNPCMVPSRHGGQVRDWWFELRGAQVLGLCIEGQPFEIIQGAGEQRQYNAETAEHEGAHFHLMQHGDWGHNPRYRPYFAGWSDTGARRLPPGYHRACIDFVDGRHEVAILDDDEIDALHA